MKTKLITLRKLSERGNPPKCAVKLVVDLIAVKYWGRKLWKDSVLKLLCKHLHSCSMLNEQMLGIIDDAL